jgi:hypothetical protein
MWVWYGLIGLVGLVVGAIVGYTLKSLGQRKGTDGTLNLYLPANRDESPEMYLEVNKTIHELENCDSVVFQLHRITDRR